MNKTLTTSEVAATGTIELERKAELTLLSITLPMSKTQCNKFLSDMKITRPEYERILKKYSRVVERWKEENK